MPFAEKPRESWRVKWMGTRPYVEWPPACLATMSARWHVNRKPEMEAYGQGFYAAPAVRWCITIPTRAVKAKSPLRSTWRNENEKITECVGSRSFNHRRGFNHSSKPN